LELDEFGCFKDKDDPELFKLVKTTQKMYLNEALDLCSAGKKSRGKGKSCKPDTFVEGEFLGPIIYYTYVKQPDNGCPAPEIRIDLKALSAEKGHKQTCSCQ
jgi:hypothetical protein